MLRIGPSTSWMKGKVPLEVAIGTRQLTPAKRYSSEDAPRLLPNGILGVILARQAA